MFSPSLSIRPLASRILTVALAALFTLSPAGLSLAAFSASTDADSSTQRIVIFDTGVGSVSLTAVNTAFTENFDTLANAGTTNTTLPTGWYITEQGGGTRDNEQYGADDGASNTGDTYSYGAALSTERALGGLQSGTLLPFFGAKFTNDTGTPIIALGVTYTGEQWRLGNVMRADRIDFQISTDATDLTTGTYVDVNALDFTTPNSVGTGAKDGNAVGNRTTLTSFITGLSIPAGASFFIRWLDFNATGADDALAVDDFALTPNPSVLPALSIDDVTQTEGDAGATTFTFTVSLSLPALAGGVTFDIATQDDTATAAGADYNARTLIVQTIAAGNQSYTFDVTVNGDTTVEPTETFFVNVTNVIGATVSDGQGVGTIQTDDAIGPPTVTDVTPNTGSARGGTAITITGMNFQPGATVTLGGVAATSVNVANSTTITATTPAHTRGLVDVVVTNPDTQNGTLANGFRYGLFDPDGDNALTILDVFYLINHIFSGGPAPVGGTSSGDADADGDIDATDVFVLLDYLFAAGPEPA